MTDVNKERAAVESYEEHLEALRARCFWWYPATVKLIELNPKEICRCLRLNGGREGWSLAQKICQ